MSGALKEAFELWNRDNHLEQAKISSWNGKFYIDIETQDLFRAFCGGAALSRSAPAPEGMGRFTVVHDGPSRPMLSLGNRIFRVEEFINGRWQGFDDDEAICAALAHPISESGTDDLRFQVGKLLEEQGEDFRLAHAELLDAYHAMEAESGTDAEQRLKDIINRAKVEAQGRWCEWGERAERVEVILEEAEKIHVKAESGRVEEQDWVEWVEPFGVKDEPVYMRVTKQVAIEKQKQHAANVRKGFVYENDQQAFDDFITVHGASHSKPSVKEK